MSPTERVIVASPIPAAGGRVLVSPFQYLVTGEDNLRIEGWNSKAGVALEVSYRFADLKGKITPERHVVPLTADRVVTERDVKLGEGYLVNLAVFAVGAAPLTGQTFVCIKLIRGLTGATIVLGLLLGGYVTAEQGLGWPGSPIGSSLDGEGVLRPITGTDPAAGVNISETVPTGARWQLFSLAADFFTDATAGVREVLLTIDDSGALYHLASIQPFQQAPSTSRRYCWATGMPLGTSLGVQNLATLAGLPSPCYLLAGHRVQTYVANFAAGDNWGPPTFLAREWLEVN